MVALTALWLPILVAAVVVFIASSISHMVLPWHQSDYSALPDEEGVRAAMRQTKIPPGDYLVPHCTSRKDSGSDAMLKKYGEGPVGMLTIFPNGPMEMGKSLVSWFLFSIAVGVFAAYLAGHMLTPGAHYLGVFRVVGTVSFLGYAGAAPVASIWRGQRWWTTIKSMIDGLVYACLTAGVFGWLWPGV